MGTKSSKENKKSGFVFNLPIIILYTILFIALIFVIKRFNFTI